MPLEPTEYFSERLAQLHHKLVDHPIAKQYLSGTGIRFDGAQLSESDYVELPSGVRLSAQEFAHLFGVFDGSRVHHQAEKRPSRDDAPPGMYFTVINTKVIQNPHKNRSALYEEDAGVPELFIAGLHIDHFFLNERIAPVRLGSVAFALCAITAHLAGLGKISLVAAGGVGYNPRHIGFKVWPKLGFDAQLVPGDLEEQDHLNQCRTVQDLICVDPAWWDAYGSQRLMTFDLTPDSVSWRKLISYLTDKVPGDAYG